MSRPVFAKAYLQRVQACLERLDVDAIGRVVEMLEQAWLEDRQVFLAGNGGSAATASHMANDLAKTVVAWDSGIRPFRVHALTDNVPLMTAIANDVSYDAIFAGPLKTLARAGDVLIVVSGSGNSPNV